MATITLEQIINFLLEAPMFGDLDPTELSQIVHIMQVQRVREDFIIFREGDPGDAWYVIYEGSAHVAKLDENNISRRITSIGPRACFGEMAILDHSPRSATVAASCDSTIFRFPRRDFEALLREGNLAAYKLIYEMAKILSARQRRMTRELAEAMRDGQQPGRLLEASVSMVHDQAVSE